MRLIEKEAAAGLSHTPSFVLKGGLFPLSLLEIGRYNREEFERDLQAKVAEAPGFFKQAPVVLSFDRFETDLGDVSLEELQSLCRQYGLIPVALRTSDVWMTAQAYAVGLPLMTGGRGKSTAETPAAPAPAAETAPAPAETAEPEADGRSVHSNTRLVQTPIRSGQQVYAAGGDLIVLSSVSPGAEILADGNIHVYGALRGRALAGVQGDTGARIFCQSLEAELVSVAGSFKLDEAFRARHWKQASQIHLEGDSLIIEPLT